METKIIIEKITKEDLKKILSLAENFFDTESDPNQIPLREFNYKIIKENFPNCLAAIKNKDEIIGSAFIIPCKKEVMAEFINKEINERELYLAVKNKPLDYESIYLAGVFLKEKFRKKGLGSEAFIELIKKAQIHNQFPTLFYWAYSKEGKLTAESIRKKTKLTLLKRGS